MLSSAVRVWPDLRELPGAVCLPQEEGDVHLALEILPEPVHGPRNRDGESLAWSGLWEDFFFIFSRLTRSTITFTANTRRRFRNPMSDHKQNLTITTLDRATAWQNTKRNNKRQISNIWINLKKCQLSTVELNWTGIYLEAGHGVDFATENFLVEHCEMMDCWEGTWYF